MGESNVGINADITIAELAGEGVVSFAPEENSAVDDATVSRTIDPIASLTMERKPIPYYDYCTQLILDGKIREGDTETYNACMESKYGWQSIGLRLSYPSLQWIGSKYTDLYKNWNGAAPSDLKFNSNDGIFVTDPKTPLSSWSFEITNGPGFSILGDETLFRLRSGLTVYGSDQPINSGKITGTLFDADILRAGGERYFYGINPFLLRYDNKPQTFRADYVGLGLIGMYQLQGHALGTIGARERGADALLLLSGHTMLMARATLAAAGDKDGGTEEKNINARWKRYFDQIDKTGRNGCIRNEDGDAVQSWGCSRDYTPAESAGAEISAQLSLFGIQRWGWGAFAYDVSGRYFPRTDVAYYSADLSFEWILNLAFKVMLGAQAGWLCNGVVCTNTKTQDINYPTSQFDLRAYLAVQFTPLRAFINFVSPAKPQGESEAPAGASVSDVIAPEATPLPNIAPPASPPPAAAPASSGVQIQKGKIVLVGDLKTLEFGEALKRLRINHPDYDFDIFDVTVDSKSNLQLIVRALLEINVSGDEIQAFLADEQKRKSMIIYASDDNETSRKISFIHGAEVVDSEIAVRTVDKVPAAIVVWADETSGKLKSAIASLMKKYPAHAFFIVGKKNPETSGLYLAQMGVDAEEVLAVTEDKSAPPVTAYEFQAGVFRTKVAGKKLVEPPAAPEPAK